MCELSLPGKDMTQSPQPQLMSQTNLTIHCIPTVEIAYGSSYLIGVYIIYLKSGIPLGVLIPAPAMTIIFLHLSSFMRFTMSSIEFIA